jgi:multicomponent Na+:H+ antiporter subunit C
MDAMAEIFELLGSHYVYWTAMLLLGIGLYGMLFKRNLVLKVIGINIFQSSIILLWIAAAYKLDGTVPVLDPAIPVENPALYMNPLPQTLMLTAIVVGVAITGVAFALLIAIHERFGTLEEDELLERMR